MTLAPRFLAAVASAAALVTAVPLAAAASPPDHANASRTYLFNGEGNRLNVYETGDELPLPKRTLIPSASDVEGTQTPGRDINAQICFDPSDDPDGPYHFIAGEDTGQVSSGEDRGKQGWGYFELTGDELDGFSWEQQGKLEPDLYATTGDNPENYGCGFLSTGQLITSDVGDQFPQDPATGQLIIWFPPFDRGFDPDTGAEIPVPYCKIDDAIPTAGQVYIDDQDRVYVGAQRPDTRNPASGRTGGIYRYTPTDAWPTSPDECISANDPDNHREHHVASDDFSFEIFIPNSPLLASPTGVVRAPNGNFYASSVFDGRITEFDQNGLPVRPILQPEPQETGQPPYPSTGTPLGLGIDDDGTLYYADIGVVLKPDPTNPGAGPGNNNGSVRRIRFDENGDPLPPETIDGPSTPGGNDGLAFPDGIGILTIDAGRTTCPPGKAQGRDRGPASCPDGEVVAASAGAPNGTPRSLPATGGGLAVAATLILGAGLLAPRRA